ncbi:hypothetical protein DIS24_g489 [Lasiodiplodia hormozganensis]|uniref:ABC-type Fe3+ transport system n=1 Tax=Lasiodiplodia hormozganensis TaxID=869390 RepID=A0AA40D7E8_9PEZI|nr:hypothetical protein DIS24_g489 [Lasiodiplodia hormozganensis]
MRPCVFPLVLSVASAALAYDPLLGFNDFVEVESRTLDEIYQEALKEGGVVTVWHGGDEVHQQDGLKQAFEARFPGMTLDLTVDLSKYHDVNLDRQIATNDLYVDSIILQTLNDYPRWKSQGALLPYKPSGWEHVFSDFKDPDGTYTGLFIYSWSNVWNTDYVDNASAPKEFTDYLKPEFKDNLVLTYPNDDDAVLFAFDLIMKQYGYSWFDKLLEQNPRWVRGTATPATVVGSSNGSWTASFTTTLGGSVTAPYNISYPESGTFVTWPQTGAILRGAPHPEGAKLLHSFMLSEERQRTMGVWSVRTDIPGPEGLPKVLDMPGTDPTLFGKWMSDRAAVERLRFFFEDRLGPADAISPLDDDI